eukprot:2972606-Pyramimonas_sp.AAC.1
MTCKYADASLLSLLYVRLSVRFEPCAVLTWGLYNCDAPVKRYSTRYDGRTNARLLCFYSENYPPNRNVTRAVAPWATDDV